MAAIVFLSFFAAAWWVGGVQFGHAPVGLALVGPVISVLLVVFARGRLKGEPARAPADKKRAGRVLALAGAGEGLAMFVAANVLLNLGRLDDLFPVCAVILGLHFLPLAKWIPTPIYYVTGLLLVLIGLGGLALDAAHRPLAIGLAAAVVLWGSCLARLVKPAARAVPA